VDPLALELLLFEHTITHARAVGQPDGSTVDPFALELPDELLRARPHGLNSVAWNLHHTARSEDIGLSRFVVGQPELFDEEGWGARLGVAHRHNGAGMTDAEVDELSARIDLDALKAYRLAVGRRTRALLPTLNAEPLQATVDPALVDLALADGSVHPAIPPEAIRRSWGARKRGWFLFMAGGHNLQHLGETITIRSRLVVPA
jgi:hypothetical protein